MSNRQRSSIEIMTELLEVAMTARRQQFQTDGGVPISKRELMRSANLNYNQLTNYLNTLEQKGFIIRDENEQGLFIEITDTGIEFFEQASKVNNMLNN
jgi:predicted transcriptional regulator